MEDFRLRLQLNLSDSSLSSFEDTTAAQGEQSDSVTTSRSSEDLPELTSETTC